MSNYCLLFEVAFLAGCWSIVNTVAMIKTTKAGKAITAVTPNNALPMIPKIGPTKEMPAF